jgi:hypothetical protein
MLKLLVTSFSALPCLHIRTLPSFPSSPFLPCLAFPTLSTSYSRLPSHSLYASSGLNGSPRLSISKRRRPRASTGRRTSRWTEGRRPSCLCLGRSLPRGTRAGRSGLRRGREREEVEELESWGGWREGDGAGLRRWRERGEGNARVTSESRREATCAASCICSIIFP